MSNDEFQDIEDDNTDHFGEEFESGEGGSLGDLWKHSPAVKIGVVLAGFVIILGGLILFGGGAEKIDVSMAGGGSELRGDVGKEQVSPEMQREIEEYNINEIETAIESGGSALPVPITPPRGGVLVGEDSAIADDPLQRWRKIQEERQKREAQQVPDLPEVDPNAETIDALAQAMIAQMQNIISDMKPATMTYVGVTADEYFEKFIEEDSQDDNSVALEEEVPVNILVPAGTIEYAQLLIEANSDTPGPVLAQIVSGPLSGSRMLGTFSTEDDFLVLNFTSIVVDGVGQPVTAVALDPAKSTPGLVTEYNGRYFKRVFLPAAAEFITGFAEAVSQTSTTTVVVEGAAVQDSQDLNTEEELYAGLEKAADKVSEFMEEEGSSTKPLIRVAAGTPIGILFTEPVIEK